MSSRVDGSLPTRRLKVTINGTGFAGSYTAVVYGLIPHKNGVRIDLSGVCSGHLSSAKAFSERFSVAGAFSDHAEMIERVNPDIDNIACANYVHGQYVIEAARAGVPVPVIVLEKPPVIWPGYHAERSASAKVRKEESMDYLAEIEEDAKFIDVGELTKGRTFSESELPDPSMSEPVF